MNKLPVCVKSIDEVIDLNKDNNSENPQIPLGLGMAFAQNTDAMRFYSSLSPAEQQSVIDRAHGVKSKKEMRAFVSDLNKKS